MSSRTCKERHILLSSISVILYKACARTGVENNLFIKFSLSGGTYSIDCYYFDTKIKEAVSQQRKDWVPPQVKDLKLVIPEHYTFMASNIFFIANKNLEKTMQIKSTLPPGSYKTFLDTSPLSQLLSLHCKQINKFKNELDGQPSILLTSMHIFNYNFN